MIAEPNENNDQRTRGPERVGNLAGNIDDMLTVDEVAQMLKVSTRTVFRLVARGQFLAPLKLGRSVRWPKASIHTWLMIRSSYPPDPTTSPPQDPLS